MNTTILGLRVSRVMRIVLLFLAGTVFHWGLQSKLSLYDPPSQVGSLSQAKMAQTEQRRLEAVTDRTETGAPQDLDAGTLLFAGLAAPSQGASPGHTTEPCCMQLFSISSAFLDLPPPARS